MLRKCRTVVGDIHQRIGRSLGIEEGVGSLEKGMFNSFVSSGSQTHQEQ